MTVTGKGPLKIVKWQFVFSALSTRPHRSMGLPKLQVQSQANCHDSNVFQGSVPQVHEAGPQPSPGISGHHQE